MAAFVALLRAVNVGGTGKLPMSDLKKMCETLGFRKVQTYIASGNVLFESTKSESAVRKALEAALQKYAGKPVGVLVRTPAELAKVVADNPFPKKATNATVAIFLNEPPPADTLSLVRGAQAGEEVRLGKREIYVHYGSNAGMARSKLKVPGRDAGTARNMNTIAKLAELGAKL
jgi:uncharacterized protein (DUF1697 family)